MTSQKHLWKLLPFSARISWCQRRWLRCCVHPHHQRFNPLNIQMLTEMLHKQIFPSQNIEEPQLSSSSSSSSPPQPASSSPSPSTKKGTSDLARIQAHLNKFGLLKGRSLSISDVHLHLPELFGQNVDDHFRHIASEQIREYKAMAESVAKSSPPPMPKEWARQKGWTKYKRDGTCLKVPFPDDDALVFDIECLMNEGNFPTMATAMSPNHWWILN